MTHRGALATTALLLSIWATATFGARPLTPWIQDVAERVEVALGLDVARGEARPGDTDP